MARFRLAANARPEAACEVLRHSHFRRKLVVHTKSVSDLRNGGLDDGGRSAANAPAEWRPAAVLSGFQSNRLDGCLPFNLPPFPRKRAVFRSFDFRFERSGKRYGRTQREPGRPPRPRLGVTSLGLARYRTGHTDSFGQLVLYGERARKLALRHAFAVFGRPPILATVFAIGLTACSSSGNGMAGATDPDPGPTADEQEPGPTADEQEPGPTAGQQELAALQQQAMALRQQLGLTDDGDLGDGIDNLIAERDRLQQQIDDAAEAEAMRLAAELAALAAKLYAGIGTMPFGGTGADRLSVIHSAVGSIELTVRSIDIKLLEDEEALVDPNHGWEGKKFMRVLTGLNPVLDGMYDAVIYANVGEPTVGAKFNSGTGADNVGFATTGGVLTIADATNVATRIVSSSFDHGAGSKAFHFPDPKPQEATSIRISGSYYGVEGTYACTPAVAADGCRVNRAADGYTLALTGDGRGIWTFTAANPDDRVTVIVPNAEYVSYGWWTQKSPYGDDHGFVSAFQDNWDGTVPAATGIADLQGTATYSGGAAGIYALSSLTGGINDGGAFTAAATLKADFHEDMISGTIDNFVGANGQSRDWSLELKASGISDDGRITGSDGTGDPMQTVWTLGGAAADAGGQWSGNLYDNDAGGVPKIAAGTFYSTYGHEGRMVGAFGTTMQ